MGLGCGRGPDKRQTSVVGRAFNTRCRRIGLFDVGCPCFSFIYQEGGRPECLTLQIRLTNGPLVVVRSCGLLGGSVVVFLVVMMVFLGSSWFVSGGNIRLVHIIIYSII